MLFTHHFFKGCFISTLNLLELTFGIIQISYLKNYSHLVKNCDDEQYFILPQMVGIECFINFLTPILTLIYIFLFFFQKNNK